MSLSQGDREFEEDGSFAPDLHDPYLPLLPNTRSSMWSLSRFAIHLALNIQLPRDLPGVSNYDSRVELCDGVSTVHSLLIRDLAYEALAGPGLSEGLRDDPEAQRNYRQHAVTRMGLIEKALRSVSHKDASFQTNSAQLRGMYDKANEDLLAECDLQDKDFWEGTLNGIEDRSETALANCRERLQKTRDSWTPWRRFAGHFGREHPEAWIRRGSGLETVLADAEALTAACEGSAEVQSRLSDFQTALEKVFPESPTSFLAMAPQARALAETVRRLKEAALAPFYDLDQAIQERMSRGRRSSRADVLYNLSRVQALLAKTTSTEYTAEVEPDETANSLSSNRSVPTCAPTSERAQELSTALDAYLDLTDVASRAYTTVSSNRWENCHLPLGAKV